MRAAAQHMGGKINLKPVGSKVQAPHLHNVVNVSGGIANIRGASISRTQALASAKKPGIVGSITQAKMIQLKQKSGRFKIPKITLPTQLSTVLHTSVPKVSIPSNITNYYTTTVSGTTSASTTSFWNVVESAIKDLLADLGL